MLLKGLSLSNSTGDLSSWSHGSSITDETRDSEASCDCFWRPTPFPPWSMPLQPLNDVFHVADSEYIVAASLGESPLCSICREALEILSTAIIDITTDISVERRARDGCYLCLLVQHRFRDNRHSSFLIRRGPKFLVRYRKIPNFVIQVTQSCEDKDTVMCYQLESPEWMSQHTLVVAVPSRGTQPDISYSSMLY
jgi:hypothetical protein